MYGFIYLTTNDIDNKKYIGKRKCVTEEADIKYLGSGKLLLRAINKYGAQHFSKIILAEAIDEKDLCEKEAYFIQKYDAVNDNQFYNLKPGGLGKSVKGVHYIRKENKCKKVLDIDLAKYLSNGWELKGPYRSADAIAKTAKSNTGKKRSKEALENLSRSHKGISHPAWNKGIKQKVHITQSKERKVKCIEKDLIFYNLREAGRWLGDVNKCANICKAIKLAKTAYNYHWEYVN